MESLTACRQAIETLCCRVREQTEALAALGEILSSEAEALRRHDQCRYLRDLKARVKQEVEDVEGLEAIASCHSSEARAMGGVARFISGTLVATLTKSREYPLSVGARLARTRLRRTEPFGTALVGVRPVGETHEVEVVPLSRLAREHGRPEAETRVRLEADGCFLVEPETFFKVMDELEESALKGTLPMQLTDSPSPSQQREVLNHASALARLLEQKLRAKAGTILTLRRRD